MADALVGTTLLGKLRVIRKLGQGGMGTVYEVQHTLTNHRRALKLLRPEVALDADVVARFVREAGVAGTLGSDRVVQTFDAGRLDDGSLYVLMELLEGESLADRLKKGPLALREAIEVARGVCEGLRAAHAKGIVHRDIKPDNVFLVGGRPAQTKIIDFGISKFATAKLDVETVSGMMMGTPYYAAPEQLRNAKGVDGRADVYALGVMLYEMVSGIRPFEADGLAELIVKVMGCEMIPLADRVAGLPASFADVVARAMAIAPDDRYASVGELDDALAQMEPSDELALADTANSIAFAQTMASNPPPAPASDEPKSRIAVGVGLTIVAAFVIGIGALTMNDDDEPQALVDAGAAVIATQGTQLDASEPTVSEPDASEPDASELDVSEPATEPDTMSAMRPVMHMGMETMAGQDGLELELGGQ